MSIETRFELGQTVWCVESARGEGPVCSCCQRPTTATHWRVTRAKISRIFVDAGRGKQEEHYNTLPGALLQDGFSLFDNREAAEKERVRRERVIEKANRELAEMAKERRENKAYGVRSEPSA